MFIAEIEPIQGFGITVTRVKISLINYQLFGSSMDLYFGLLTADDETPVSEGRVTLDATDLASWGTDDMYVIDTAIEKINDLKDWSIVKA